MIFLLAFQRNHSFFNCFFNFSTEWCVFCLVNTSSSNFSIMNTIIIKNIDIFKYYFDMIRRKTITSVRFLWFKICIYWGHRRFDKNKGFQPFGKVVGEQPLCEISLFMGMWYIKFGQNFVPKKSSKLRNYFFGLMQCNFDFKSLVNRILQPKRHQRPFRHNKDMKFTISLQLNMSNRQKIVNGLSKSTPWLPTTLI